MIDIAEARTKYALEVAERVKTPSLQKLLADAEQSVSEAVNNLKPTATLRIDAKDLADKTDILVLTHVLRKKGFSVSVNNSRNMLVVVTVGGWVSTVDVNRDAAPPSTFESLGTEFEAVLCDNLDDLYGS